MFHWNARLLIESTALITCMMSAADAAADGERQDRRQQADHPLDMSLQVGLNNGGDLHQHRAELTGLLADGDQAQRRRRQQTRSVERPMQRQCPPGPGSIAFS